MQTYPTSSAVPAHRDRRTALVIAGIFEVILGGLAWLMVALITFSAVMAARQGASLASMIPGMLVYGVGGLAFIILGIGSMRARRWARSLWWVVSQGWLLVGLFGGLMAMFWVPSLFKGFPPGQAPPPQALAVILGVIAGFFGIFMVAIPLALFLLYRSPHVRATCEEAQSEPSWTDACPLPVLAATIWLGMSAFMMLVMPFAYGSVFPMMGSLARGFAGGLLWFLMSVVLAVAALGLYRLKPWAWGLGLAVYLFLCLTTVITYSQVENVRGLFGSMGMSEQQLEPMERMGFLKPSFMILSTLGGIVPFVIIHLGAGVSLLGTGESGQRRK